MHIAILDLATPFAGMEDQPRAGALIRDWLSPALPEAIFTVFNIGTGAALPAPLDFDGFVLSGSECSVYDGTPWIAPLRAFLLDLRAAEIPMFGICFGHQIMADTFGGEARNAALGNIMGARRFVIGGIERDAFVWHQDQVTAIPPEATVIGGADYCPAAVLQYDFPALSVQFHPEYTDAMLRTEISIVSAGGMPQAQADAAYASMGAAEVSADLMAWEAAELMRGAVAGRMVA